MIPTVGIRSLTHQPSPLTAMIYPSQVRELILVPLNSIWITVVYPDGETLQIEFIPRSDRPARDIFRQFRAIWPVKKFRSKTGALIAYLR